MEFLGILYLERFPETDREDWANAILGYCREMQRLDGVNFARFFWVDANRIAIIIAADTADARDAAMRNTTPRIARAGFDVLDMSRLTRSERLSDPRQAMYTYRTAGR